MNMSLRQLASSKGFTMTQLAKETGITQEYLSKLNNHKQQNPTLDVLNKIAKTLEITITEVGKSITVIGKKNLC